MAKKRTVCTMMPENREYAARNIPLEKMGCVGKNAGRVSSSAFVSYHFSLNVIHVFIIAAMSVFM